VLIAYVSKALSRSERNYCVTRREMLAVIYYMRAFRQFLLGWKFLIRTDHGALQWMQKTTEPIGQQARWCEILQEFDYNIEHRAGRLPTNANAMSRRPCRQCRHSGEMRSELINSKKRYGLFDLFPITCRTVTYGRHSHLGPKACSIISNEAISRMASISAESYIFRIPLLTLSGTRKRFVPYGARFGIESNIQSFIYVPRLPRQKQISLFRRDNQKLLC